MPDSAINADTGALDGRSSRARAGSATRWLLSVVRRAAVLDLIAICALALLMRVLFQHAEPDTDPTFALVWGRDIVHGRLPAFGFPSAPTAHPLPTLEAVALAPLGRDGAASALVFGSYLCLGWILWGTFRLGEAAFSRPIAVLAMALVGTNFATVDVGLAAFLDAQFIAIVLWAVVLEVRRPRRGMSVLLLLSVAGLLRPEAWLLAAAYWVYAFRGRDDRAVAALAVVAAPLGWIVMDAIVTGQPLFAFTNARQSTEGVALGTATNSGLASFAVSQLRNAMRAPVLLGGAVGVLLALRSRFQATKVPAAVLLLLLLVFAAFIVLRLPVPDRMLGTPAVILALFCAYAALGWLTDGSGVQRRVWAAAGAAILALLVATAPGEISRLTQLNQRRASLEESLAGLRSLDHRQPPGWLASCRVLSVGASEMVPYAAYYLDWPLQRLRLRNAASVAPGAYLVLTPRAANPVLGGFEVHQGTDIPSGFDMVAGNRSWRVYTTGC